MSKTLVHMMGVPNFEGCPKLWWMSKTSDSRWVGGFAVRAIEGDGGQVMVYREEQGLGDDPFPQ